MFRHCSGHYTVDVFTPSLAAYQLTLPSRHESCTTPESFAPGISLCRKDAIPGKP